MRYTLGEAARATGKSKATIHRAVKSGKISAHRMEDGSYEIDPAELHRVFEPVSRNGSTEPDLRRNETPNETGALLRELEVLREERERERSSLQDTISDLRRRLDQSETERRETQAKLTALLTHQAEKVEEKPTAANPQQSPLWQKLFGRGKP